MKIFEPPFTDDEIITLKGSYSNIASKTNVTPGYVRQIAIGLKDTSSDKAKEVLQKLKNVLTALNS